jgi:hypothetical protein
MVIMRTKEPVRMTAGRFFVISLKTFADVMTHSFMYLAVCLTTGPTPLPKRALHVVRSRASSFRCSGGPRKFFGGWGVKLGIFSGEGSTNSDEDRGQKERGSGGGSLLEIGSIHFANQ